jgi:hypothetical protein
MTDILIPLGGMSIGASIPGPAGALALVVPSLQVQLAGYASFTPVVNPPDFTADAAVGVNISADIALSAGMGLTPPSVSAQVNIMLSVIAALQAQINAILGVTNLFTTAGMFGYAYDGQWSGFAPSLPGSLPGGNPGDHCNAILLVTSVGACWSAMSTVFKVSP